MGLLIAVVILKGTWLLFADSFRLIIDGVPSDISLSEVSDYLSAIPGVKSIHDLHIWAMSTQENALSVHILMPDAPLSDELRKEISEKLNKDFNIQHITIQVERTEMECNDACHNSNKVI
jgi:cobalt-zinc-cadmium efflux system protein